MSSTAISQGSSNLNQSHKSRESMDDMPVNPLDKVNSTVKTLENHHAKIKKSFHLLSANANIESAGSDRSKSADDYLDKLTKHFGALDGNGSMSGAAAIAEINDLMTKLATLFQELRNIIQDFDVKQEQLAWAVQVSGYDQKSAGIGQQATASILSGSFTIVGGAFGVLGGSLGAGFSSEAAAIAGQSIGKSLEGSGGVANATLSKTAEEEKLVGGFDESNANTFIKKLVEMLERARKTSADMVSLLTELTQLHRSLENALMK
ncbi:MAG: hypothetical protein HAW66_04195 [Shewanella sp.]|nr:hypothetical protein [Shewanella sp.]